MHSMYSSVVLNYSPLIVECGRYQLCRYVGGVNDGRCGWDHCRGGAYLVNVVSDRVGDDYFYDGAFVAAVVGRLPLLNIVYGMKLSKVYTYICNKFAIMCVVSDVCVEGVNIKNLCKTPLGIKMDVSRKLKVLVVRLRFL